MNGTFLSSVTVCSVQEIIMARMILTLSAVFLFISPVCALIEQTGLVHSESSAAMPCPVVRHDMGERYQLRQDRAFPFAPFTTSLVEVSGMVNELLQRYPHFKFAFCVTHAGDIIVLDETRLTYCDDMFSTECYRAAPVDGSEGELPRGDAPITAFHIASMTSDSGYNVLPRPLPVLPPAVVLDGTRKQRPGARVTSAPVGRPHSVWRNPLMVEQTSYVLLLGLPAVTS